VTSRRAAVTVAIAPTAHAPVPVSRPPAHTVAHRHMTRVAETLQRVPVEPLNRAIDLLLAARTAGRRVWVVGNGGSAALASHLVCDLTKTAAQDGGRPLRSFALTDNVPLLSAWANDTAYERVFAAQIEALVDRDDVVIAISSSGKSPNIVAAVRSAQACGAQVIGLIGFQGGDTRDLADVAIHVPANDYGVVEDVHAAVGHALAAALRSIPAEVPIER
jgi:D-sedoheptulose 7-phosphate isomerase